MGLRKAILHETESYKVSREEERAAAKLKQISMDDVSAFCIHFVSFDIHFTSPFTSIIMSPAAKPRNNSENLRPTNYGD